MFWIIAWIVTLVSTIVFVGYCLVCFRKTDCPRKGCKGKLYPYDYNRWFCDTCGKEA